VKRTRPDIVVHRRRTLTALEITHRHNIPVTTPICTIIDLAATRPRDEVEHAIGEADKRGYTDPEAIRAALDEIDQRPGEATLRKLLDRRTFVLTDSKLERRFLPIAREAGLPLPITRRYANSFRVDFQWPELGLVVETDGLRYHRTPAQQAKDRVRDQTHTAAGLTCLRFTHEQIAFERSHVVAILTAVAARLDGRAGLYSPAL
jgi:very-short-patch-repair endonuclease